MTNVSNHIKNKSYLLLAAILPVLFMLTAYAQIGIYPFGDKTVYTWDLQGQYSSFMFLIRHLLTGEEHISYSLTGGFGGNLYGLIAYYLGSPFNLITFFCNEKTMPLGIMFLMLLKTACMGLFMFLYLYRKKHSPIAILFSTAYAFSAYAIVYQSNIMWMDALVFLPLVILGLEKLIEEKKCFLYMIALGLTIISNYFTAYMVCLFVVFYFVGYMLFLEWKKTNVRNHLKTVVRFALSSLCAGGLSAFLLLPMFYEMQSGMGRQNVKWEAIRNGAKLFYYRSILPMLFSCSYDDSQRWDCMGTFPLLYCGVIAILGSILFFMARNISWGQKAFRAFLLAVILVSSNHMNLFFIWHGFYTPYGAPWRFIFLWSFALLTVAYEGTAAFVEDKNRIYDGAAITGVLLYCFWVFWRFDIYRRITIYNAVIICCGMAGVFFWKYGKLGRKIVVAAVCILVLGIELISNAVYTWNQGFVYESYTDYLDYIGKMEQEIVKEAGIYRSEIISGTSRSLNDGFLWNLNTIGSYTSTSKKKTYDIGRCLNIGELRDVRIYNESAPFLSKEIVSLRYIYGGETADVGYEKVKTTQDGINVFENKNVLPFGFLVNRKALEITAEDAERDMYENQNVLFHALAGSKGMEGQNVCQKATGYEETGAYTENIELIQTAVDKTAEATLSLTSKKVSDVTSVVRNDLGETAYVCYSVPYESGWKAWVDGEETAVVEGMGGFLLVPIEVGEHEVRISYTAPGSKAGALLSLFCLTGMFIYIFLDSKKKSFQETEFGV